MVDHILSSARINVADSLSSMAHAASHRVHLSTMWKIMLLCMKTKSHSTCWLNVSGRSIFIALLGPGWLHARQISHVAQISGIIRNTWSGTPTRSRNFVITFADACHQRTCSLRRDNLIALSRFVRNSRTTLPISKLDQSAGFSGLSPASRQVRRTR